MLPYLNDHPCLKSLLAEGVLLEYLRPAVLARLVLHLGSGKGRTTNTPETVEDMHHSLLCLRIGFWSISYNNIAHLVDTEKFEDRSKKWVEMGTFDHCSPESGGDSDAYKDKDSEKNQNFTLLILDIENS